MPERIFGQPPPLCYTEALQANASLASRLHAELGVPADENVLLVCFYRPGNAADWFWCRHHDYGFCQ